MKTFNTKFKEKYEYYNIDPNNPVKGTLRADLKAIPLALSKGYNVIEGKTFGDEVRFAKDNIRIWKTREYIVKAEIIDNTYCNHNHFSSYQAAFSENTRYRCSECGNEYEERQELEHCHGRHEFKRRDPMRVNA